MGGAGGFVANVFVLAQTLDPVTDSVSAERVFTVNAFNHHHGMQAVERFGAGQKDNRGAVITTSDFDEDGVFDELTAGDITAATIFQAALNIPGRVLPGDRARRAAAERGEESFAASCGTWATPRHTGIAAI